MFTIRFVRCYVLMCTVLGFVTTTEAAEIAPFSVGLTLAQATLGDGDSLDTLLVLSEDETSIEAVNLSRELHAQPDDPLWFVAEYGYTEIEQVASSATVTTINKAQLRLSPTISQHHIAAGTNYLAHQEEAGIDSGFLFPKLGLPTRSGATVKTGPKILLDYEVELCLRFSQSIRTVADFDKAIKGFIICGDMTDRAALLRNIDTSDVASGRGFTDGKSGVGRLPLGLYTLAAKDWHALLGEIQINTHVNGVQRQKGLASNMIKNPQQLLQDALYLGNKKTWSYQQQAISLLQDKQLSPSEVLLTGTPSGVIFNDISTTAIIGKTIKWLWSLSFVDSSVFDYVIEQTISEALVGAEYLQAGDKIRLTGTYLGAIDITVTD